MCLSHLIYTVRPCLVHTRHAMSMPRSDHAVLLKITAQHDRQETAVLCCGLEKNGMVGAWHGMASVNQTRLHCVNQMGKTNSKPLAARHAMCESAFIVQCTELNIRFLLAIFEGGKKSARMGFLRLAGTRHIQQTHCFFQVDVLYVSFLKTCVWIRECT